MNEEAVGIEPVVKTVTVGLDIERAFALFTEGMGRWWPLQTHGVAADTHGGRIDPVSVVFEGREGGRIYETLSDGSEADWGRVLVWERPARVAFTWKPNLTNSPETEVEVRFTAAGDDTQVELEHRGWERFGDEAADRRAGYDAGWPGVLELFSAAATSASPL